MYHVSINLTNYFENYHLYLVYLTEYKTIIDTLLLQPKQHEIVFYVPHIFKMVSKNQTFQTLGLWELEK